VDKGILCETTDGVTYRRIRELDVLCINETTIRFGPDGEAIMLGCCDNGEHASSPTSAFAAASFIVSTS
jgi:hypothetical protein